MDGIMRQRESRQFAEILNRLREGIQTDNDWNVLRTRMIDDSDPNYPRHAPHLLFKMTKLMSLTSVDNLQFFTW